MSPRSRPLHPPYLHPGGTRRLADFALECVPEYFGDYYEPFLGGGALAIALMERNPGRTFRLSSDDSELVITWQVLQSDVGRLVRLVGEHRERHDHVHRAAVEAQADPESAGGSSGSTESSRAVGAARSLSPVERAARFVYLRGSAGRDTVAFDEVNLRGVARLLQNRDVTVRERHFYDIVAEVREEDLVYFDPPFAGAGPGFDRETRSLANTLTARGAYLLAPEPSAPGTGEPAVYTGWKTMAVAADRGDGDRLWANGTLDRVRRRAAHRRDG
ncbi:DNA adenine methylase [Subtercola boreus]|uniref:DNA adenine methylase n=1 Tax=Subtercola boreus TaxID=120213 RepID=UPI0015597C40|nr:DNA adenine methylase [Subtercola boreus]